MAHDSAMRRPRAGACRGRRIAPPPVPPPNTPPALNRCDEAAGLKAVLMRELCTIQPFVWTY